jgi:hypothetical protein
LLSFEIASGEQEQWRKVVLRSKTGKRNGIKGRRKSIQGRISTWDEEFERFKMSVSKASWTFSFPFALRLVVTGLEGKLEAPPCFMAGLQWREALLTSNADFFSWRERV